MFKIIFLYTLVFILSGCGSLEFVYDKSPTINQLKNQTFFYITGDNTDTITRKLSMKVGDSEKNKKYNLDIISSKTTENIVIGNDQKASSVEVRFKIKYLLKNANKSCVIMSEEISNFLSYNSKSSGYNFGSSIASKEVLEQTIDDNINMFLNKVVANQNNLSC